MPAYQRPVVILGAGATKACQGPLTTELLPRAYDGDKLKPLARKFLHEVFHVPDDGGPIPEDRFPPLPLLLSLIDQAIDRKQPFQANWPAKKVEKVRELIEYSIYKVIRDALLKIPAHADYHDQLVRAFEDTEPVLVSLNYDVIADNAILHAAQRRRPPALPSYHIYGAADVEHDETWGKILKLHGSLSWAYCPYCERLDLTMSREKSSFVKAGAQLFRGRKECSVCKAMMRPVMITPTQTKDYRNSHIRRIWFRAAESLRRADRAVFVGYSLPDDDLEVIYLLKRGLSHLPPKAITVVEKARGEKEKNAVYRRYRTLFGEGIDWQPGAFAGWLNACRRAGRNPLRDEAP